MAKQEIELSLLIKLGSIAVHADEYTSAFGEEVDKEAIRSLLDNPEVIDWIKANQVMLPRKRVGPGYDERSKLAKKLKPKGKPGAGQSSFPPGDFRNE